MGHSGINPYIFESGRGFAVDVGDKEGIIIKFILTNIKLNLSNIKVIMVDMYFVLLVNPRSRVGEKGLCVVFKSFCSSAVMIIVWEGYQLGRGLRVRSSSFSSASLTVAGGYFFCSTVKVGTVCLASCARVNLIARCPSFHRSRSFHCISPDFQSTVGFSSFNQGKPKMTFCFSNPVTCKRVF
jgi:hypothetical protein